MERSAIPNHSTRGRLRTLEADEFARRLQLDDRIDKRFAFFLGAGCSVTSSIPTAADLVKEHWLPRLHRIKSRKPTERYARPGPLELQKWATEQIPDYDPQNPAASYEALVHLLFLTPDERQREIDSLCENRVPSFAYAVLAQLFARADARFNIALTTNFDDLLADALHLYTAARPIVVAHESLASFTRPTRARPLIVKLHGDCPLAHRNPEFETERLAEQIRQSAAMLLQDRGLISMGWGGQDVFIQTLLNELPPTALPHGCFWVHPEEPRGAIRGWLEQRGGTWVQGSFDQVMLKLRNVFDLPHPEPKPFSETFFRYRRRLNELERAQPFLAEEIRATEDSFPGEWKAVVSAQRLLEKPEEAEKVYRQALKDFPQSAALLGQYAWFLHNVQRNPDEAEKHYRKALELEPRHARILANYAWLLQSARKDPLGARTHLERALKVDSLDADVLGSYAWFVQQQYRYDEAELHYTRALQAPWPENKGWIAARYAGLVLARGRSAEGKSLVETARLSLESQSERSIRDRFLLECWFYLYSNAHVGREDALRRLKEALLRTRARSDGSFSANLERARIDGHPDVEWLPKLAAVITGDAEPASLDAWPVWKVADARSGAQLPAA